MLNSQAFGFPARCWSNFKILCWNVPLRQQPQSFLVWNLGGEDEERVEKSKWKACDNFESFMDEMQCFAMTRKQIDIELEVTVYVG